MASAVYIRACAALGPHLDYLASQRRVLQDTTPLASLKELTREVTGQSLRQASHFVELAAIGSQLCLKRLPQMPGAATGVYLATGLADVGKNMALFQQVLPPGPGMASPFDFINSANNMAAFYVAKLAGLVSRNLTLMQEEFSFEWAVHLAAQDLRYGGFQQVLVGGVDERPVDRTQQRRRIALNDGQIMGEGSAWLVLSREPAHARGEWLGLRHYSAGDADWVETAAAQCAAWRLGEEPVVLLPGFQLSPQAIRALQTQLGAPVHIQDYLPYCGCYHTASAFGLVMALEQPPRQAGLRIHVNRNRAGETLLMAVRSLPDTAGENVEVDKA